MWLVILIHRNNINLNHRGRAKFSVSVKCLVLVKMYGNNPKKLFVKIIRNNDVRMNEFPIFSFPFLRIVFISWCSLFISKFTMCIMLFRDRINTLSAELNPICHLLALLGAHGFLHVRRVRVNQTLVGINSIYS
jgi:hypothetical protein